MQQFRADAKILRKSRISSEKRSDTVLSQNSKVEIYFEPSIKETYLFSKEKKKIQILKGKKRLHIFSTPKS